MRALFAVVALVVVGCSSSPTDATSSDGSTSSGATSSTGTSTLPPSKVTVCNGHAELCARSYVDVTFPGDHDAYANVADGFIAADQTYPLGRQLDDGVRVLHLEVQPNAADGNRPSLCHGACILGSQRLVDGLTEIRKFVDAHPAELVTLLMETTNVTTDDVASACESSGIAPYARRQTLGDPWPTLGAMLNDGERVVAFLVADGAPSPYLLDRWSFTWETPWDNESLDDFRRCDVDRGTKGNDVYVVDTYLEDMAITNATEAARVNVDPFLVERVLLCSETEKQRPNLAMVNFYEVGDLFHTVDVLNGFADAPVFEPSDFPPSGAGGAGGANPGAGGAGGR